MVSLKFGDIFFKRSEERDGPFKVKPLKSLLNEDKGFIIRRRKIYLEMIRFKIPKKDILER